MVKLLATPAFGDKTAMEIGGVTLTPVEEAPVTSIAPFKGRDVALPLPFPAPNSHAGDGTARIMWAGRGRALLIGVAAPDLAGQAAVVDQTGAEAVLRITGADAEAVLARLVPIDLRVAAFGEGALARTMVAHMTASVLRVPEGYELRVMRSMAGTLWHDVSQAARLFAARSVT